MKNQQNLRDLYSESTRYANRVGHIDRPDQFEKNYLAPYIQSRELYYFNKNNLIAGVVRLTASDSPLLIWSESDAQHLYISKLATSEAVRGKGFFSKEMLPRIQVEAKRRGKTGLRLSCLADNPKLIDFYASCGFSHAGTARIFSNFYKKRIVITGFERAV